MINRISASDPRGLNKGHDLKFPVSSRVRQATPEEGWKTYRPKRCEYNNKDVDNCPKTLKGKNQASSQKFRQRFTSSSVSKWLVYFRDFFVLLYYSFFPKKNPSICIAGMKERQYLFMKIYTSCL